MKAARIPLFPLEVVLFPGTPLPLHIFEPRYKLLIRQCLTNGAAFGVVLTRSEGIAAVGCTAEIVEVAKKYEDGRMDIVTMGRAAFRVEEVIEEQEYLESTVEYLEEDASPGSRESQQSLLQLYEQCHALVYGRESKPPVPVATVSLTFHIASELPLDLEFKQELLEARAEADRQQRLLERLRLWLPQLSHLERVRGKAAGNGHGLP